MGWVRQTALAALAAASFSTAARAQQAQVSLGAGYVAADASKTIDLRSDGLGMRSEAISAQGPYVSLRARGRFLDAVAEVEGELRKYKTGTIPLKDGPGRKDEGSLEATVRVYSPSVGPIRLLVEYGRAATVNPHIGKEEQNYFLDAPTTWANSYVAGIATDPFKPLFARATFNYVFLDDPRLNGKAAKQQRLHGLVRYENLFPDGKGNKARFGLELEGEYGARGDLSGNKVKSFVAGTFLLGIRDWLPAAEVRYIKMFGSSTPGRADGTPLDINETFVLLGLRQTFVFK